MVHPDLMYYFRVAAIPGGLAAIGWLGKYFFGLLADEWRDTKEKITLIQHATQVQAENHLQTIQLNTAKTNEILEKMATGQAEMNGWLKGRL